MLKKSLILILPVAAVLQFGCSQTAQTNANQPAQTAAANNQVTADTTNTAIAPNAANSVAAGVQSESNAISAKNTGGSPAENAQRQAEQIADFFIKGEYDKFFDVTHPKIVEKTGGREKMTAQIKESIEEMKSQGVEFVSMTVDKPTQIETVGKETFAILPAKLTLRAPAGDSVQESFLLGVSEDNGQNWKFVNGSTKAQLKTLFPAAVEKLRIPEPKAPVFTGKK